MAVRNFYAMVKVDGRKTDVGTGPQSKTGGLTINLTVRNKGEVTPGPTVECYVDMAGRLVVNIFDPQGVRIYHSVNER